MSITTQIKMGHTIDWDTVTFRRNPNKPGNALAQLESEFSPIVTQRAAQLVKDGRGEESNREWTEEEQRHIERLKSLIETKLVRWGDHNESYRALRWALARLESLEAPAPKVDASSLVSDNQGNIIGTVEVVQVLRGLRQWGVRRWGPADDWDGTDDSQLWKALVDLLDRLDANDVTEAKPGASSGKPGDEGGWHQQVLTTLERILAAIERDK